MNVQTENVLEEQALTTILVRVHSRAWGVATGLLFGLVLFLATLILVLAGGDNVGSHLGRLCQVLPGYDVTVGGSFIGFIYAFVIGYAVGRLIGPRRPVAKPVGQAKLTAHPPINGGTWGLTTGLLFGLGLFAVTNALVYKAGEDVGPFLGRLAVYFPGYAVSFVGSLVGFAYAFALGYGCGRLIGAIYNRLVRPG